MAYLRPLFVAVLGSASLLACGGGTSAVAPEGTHYHYVANRVLVPNQPGDAQLYGLDLNGDGTIDNALGTLLTSLEAEGLNAQTSIDEAIFGGGITLLADFQTTDFTAASAAGLQVYLGTDPQPPACSTGESVTCGSGATATCSGCQHDLTGTGMFQIDASSPMDAALSGPVVGGTFKGGPGALSIEIALGGGGSNSAIPLDLIGARVQATDITATAIGDASAPTGGGLILAGAVTQDDLMNKVIPAVVTVVAGVLATHCPDAMPGACNCDDTGMSILSIFNSTMDCSVSADDILNSNFASSLLGPDVTIDGKPSLSLGVKAFAVGATYTVPSEM